MDALEAWLQHDVDLEHRTIYAGKGVGNRMAAHVIKALHVLDDRRSSITLILNTEGGDWYQCLAIIDAIRATRSPVHIRGLGSVMSAGAVILQAGDHRELGRNATVMLHYGEDSSDYEAKTAERWALERKRVNAAMEGIFLARIREKHPGFKVGELRRILDRDTIYSASQAVKMGLADSIVSTP